jgi:hypothetical protein
MDYCLQKNKMGSQWVLALLILFAFTGVVNGQTTLLSEDFEDGTVEYTTSITEDISESTDYFGRIEDGVDTPNPSFTNLQGAFYFGAQDIDGITAAPSLPVTLDIDDIDINGYTSLTFRVYLAEDDDGSNQDWDAADYVHFKYDIDNTDTFYNLLLVEADIASGSNGEPAIDTDSSGVGDGTKITSEFVEFTANISGTGSLLDIKIEFSLDSGDEDIAIDEIVLTGVSSGAVVNPSDETASATSTTQLDLSWTENGDSDNVLLAFNTSNSFGTPTDGQTYASSDALGDATVLQYSGTDSYSHTSLTANTTYYYKIWSYDGSEYSGGVEFNGTTLKAEPTAHVTGFSASANGASTVDLSWTDAATGTVPEGYLILASTTDSFTAPSDGTAQSDDTDLGDGTGQINVTQGTGSYSLTGLGSETTYYFEIYPYTNTGSNIDYKIDGTVPSDNATTGEAPKLIISEVIDPSDDFNGRYVELFNAGSSTIDFESVDYFIVRQANGGSIVSEKLTGTLGSKSTYVIGNSSNLNTAYGSAADLDFGSITGNGDDGYWIATDNTDDASLKSSIVDIYGVVDEDGSGNAWEYEDSRAVRSSDITDAKATWTTSEWTITSANIVDATYKAHPEHQVEITGTAGWRMLSAPISGFTVEDISDNTAIQGVTGGDNTGFDANFQFYNNGTSGIFDEPTNVTTAIDDGLGFIVYFYNNTTAGSSTLPITLDVTGTEPSGDVTTSLYSGAANQFTMVGNPFASNFNTNGITATGGAIQNNIAFWNNSTDSYVTQDRTASSGFIVSPWQGFWVETSDADVTSIDFPAASKTTSDSTNSYFGKEANTSFDVNFKLISDVNTDQDMRLSFRQDANTDWDLSDASKLTPLLSEFASVAFVNSSHSGNDFKSVESLPTDLDEEIVRNIHVMNNGVSGTAELAWEIPADLAERMTFTLIDREADIQTVISSENSYSFELAQTAAKVTPATESPVLQANGTDARFSLIISPNETTSNEGINSNLPKQITLKQNYPNPFNPGTTIAFDLTEATQIQLNVYNMLGQKVGELLNETRSAGSHNVYFDASSLTSGVYYYELVVDGQRMTRKMTLLK